MKIGEFGKKFYIILSGSVLILVPKKKNLECEEDKKQIEIIKSPTKKLQLIKDNFSYEKF